jgi:hypothetical protein
VTDVFVLFFPVSPEKYSFGEFLSRLLPGGGGFSSKFATGGHRIGKNKVRTLRFFALPDDIS